MVDVIALELSRRKRAACFKSNEHVVKEPIIFRVLDDYLPMELLHTSIGNGAVKQLIAVTGKTHQVYSQLRNHTPIPNVKIYYTTPKIGDLPEWYHYGKSVTVPDLVLVAQPGYAILTRDSRKQIPQRKPQEVLAGMSGYNNHYPEMLGVFLAYGPVFRKGHHKGPLQLCDIYALMCAILHIDGCHTSCGRILRVNDVLTNDARVALTIALPTSGRAPSEKMLLFIAVLVVYFYM
uniref:glycerophosphocholine cholinephosphodiesterase n=1 Tax=Angiostrongylus cantonensis TaxID=6313 RepID=A0A158P7M6_ANGCA